MGGREAAGEEGEEEARRCRMELRMRAEEAAGEARLESRRGPAEGEAGESLGWAGEAAGRPCPAVTEGEAGAQRWELWRGEEAAGRPGPGREAGEEGPSCGGGVEEEDHLWMEEVEELVSVAHF